MGEGREKLSSADVLGADVPPSPSLVDIKVAARAERLRSAGGGAAPFEQPSAPGPPHISSFNPFSWVEGDNEPTVGALTWRRTGSGGGWWFFYILLFLKKACRWFHFEPKSTNTAATPPAPQSLFAFCFFSLQTTLSACSKQASIDRADWVVTVGGPPLTAEWQIIEANKQAVAGC